MNKNEEITFLSFTAKRSERVLNDVAVDLEKRYYRIETTDVQGKIIQDPVEGRLRTRRVREYQEALKDINIVSWPILKESIIKNFPTRLDHLVVWYTFSEDEEGFETQGRTTEDLVKIHQLTEELISHTFGSYEFYGK